jgi:hypothetical protein
MLAKPENKQKLTSLLTYHVVAGKLSAKKLGKEIAAVGGQVQLKTVNGVSLTGKASGDTIELVDAKVGTLKATIADVDERSYGNAVIGEKSQSICRTDGLSASIEWIAEADWVTVEKCESSTPPVRAFRRSISCPTVVITSQLATPAAVTAVGAIWR